jgi:CHASE3 domain sensor protein
LIDKRQNTRGGKHLSKVNGKILATLITAAATLTAAYIYRSASSPTLVQINQSLEIKQRGSETTQTSQNRNAIVEEPPEKSVTSQTDPERNALLSEVEGYLHRFQAAESSLNRRMKDLEGLSPKPEIISAIETCRSELAHAKQALDRNDSNSARASVARIKQPLAYLESR